MDTTDKCQTVIVQLPTDSVVYTWFFEIHQFYRPIHMYISILLCAVGAVCNFCNIVVLTRKQMRTPVNMILTAMACCDTVVLFSNLIYTTHYTFVAFANCHPRHWSYGWALFLIAHAHLSLVGHSSSVWLSVMLAFIRYLTLRSRGKMAGAQIDLKHSYIAIASVIMGVSLMNAPNFLTYKIVEMGLNETCIITDESVRDASAYVPGVSDVATQADCLVFRMAFWISGIVFKVIPCLLLTLFVWLLTRILDEVKENRMRLLKGSRRGVANGTSPSGATSDRSTTSPREVVVSARPSLQRNNSVKWRKSNGDRTTRMLLAIVCVFLITELPQGIMAVLSGMFSEEFRRYIYNNLGDILDLLSLCGACTSFIIYCTMSTQFRAEFRRVFIPAQVSCWMAPDSLRRCSDAFVNSNKSTYLKPDTANGNGTDRSITMTVVGSNTSVRKTLTPSLHNNNHEMRAISPFSVSCEDTAVTTASDYRQRTPPVDGSEATSPSSSEETFVHHDGKDEAETVDETAGLLQLDDDMQNGAPALK